MKIGVMYIQVYQDGTKVYLVPIAECKNGSVKVKIRSGRERKWRQDHFQPEFWNRFRECSENEKVKFPL